MFFDEIVTIFEKEFSKDEFDYRKTVQNLLVEKRYFQEIISRGYQTNETYRIWEIYHGKK